MNVIKVTLLLADAAQAIGGKLYILGGGWSITGPEPAPMAIALKIEVPWDQANIKHDFRLVLLDADGNHVTTKTDKGEKNIEISGNFEAGRRAGLIPGTPLDVSLAINFPAFPLKPSSRYAWKLYINEKTEAWWSVGFSTRTPKA